MGINIYYLAEKLVTTLHHSQLTVVGIVFCGILGVLGMLVYLAGVLYSMVRKTKNADHLLPETVQMAVELGNASAILILPPVLLLHFTTKVDGRRRDGPVMLDWEKVIFEEEPPQLWVMVGKPPQFPGKQIDRGKLFEEEEKEQPQLWGKTVLPSDKELEFVETGTPSK
ncbi:hypothetical protein ACH5RR_003898 [Cinchona calisaya]|uniref:Uncharacterized protein n=1 Tax=Cinchona calisaya TaxID=153742 RepID=A0ABD3AWU3_9GENT